MAGERSRELQEALLPRQTQSNGSWIDGFAPFLHSPFSSSLSQRHGPSTVSLLDETTSVPQQGEFLESLLDYGTRANYSEESRRNKPPNHSTDETGSVLRAMTGSDSSNTSSGIFCSSSEIASSSSLSTEDVSVAFGGSSDTSSAYGKPGVQTPTGQIIRGPRMVTGGFGDVISLPNVNDVTSTNSPCIDLAGIEPFDAEPIDINRYIYDLEVTFLDLKNRVFEKQQSRKDNKAKQRIVNGKVTFLVRSDRLVRDVRVWVRRELKAAKAINDDNGEVPINADCEMREGNNWKYQVDLDSVYHGRSSPVYALARVNTLEKNKFELLVQVVFSNGEVSERFKSEPFVIRTLTKRTSENNECDSRLAKERRVTSQVRPHTCPTRSARWHHGTRAPGNSANEEDSTDSPSPASAAWLSSPSNSRDVSSIDELVVEHLDAQRAHIRFLTCNNLQTPKGDIAYHMKLTNPGVLKSLEEGVVVGFFPNDEGPAMIERLTSENASQAVMAGVISRSAYVEAHAPREKGKTDVVCVIGMVKVQIVGSVRAGERIFTSTDYPGTAIPESHLPLSAFIVKNHTLLGMAMESCKPRHHDEVNLVKCFVCIVLGINSLQLSSEVENILESTDMDIKVAIRKSNKKTSRRMILIVIGMLTFLGLLAFFLYELLAPGTLLRYYFCRNGSISGSKLYCTDIDKSTSEDVELHGVEFTLDKIKEKLPPGIHTPEPAHPGQRRRYYLNIDYCAYGGRAEGSVSPIGNSKPVRGHAFWATNDTCSVLYIYNRTKLIVDNTQSNDRDCTCDGVEATVDRRWNLFWQLGLTCLLNQLLT